MKIYFDTEFEGLRKDAKLISLGLITEDNQELYIEFDDIDIQKQDQWIKDNVLQNTILYGQKEISEITDEANYYKGDKDEIKGVLLHWLNQFDNVQFISDVCHYDFVFLIDIFGSAWDLPKNVIPCCHDINQDIMDLFWLNEKEAFDFSREDILDNLGLEIKGNKHNSLYDAKVIKAIYEYKNGLI